MKTAVVVGTGAGGATIARELQGAYEVTVLEAGGEFRPFAASLAVPEALKRIGLLFDEREIRLMFPAMKIDRSSDGDGARARHRDGRHHHDRDGKRAPRGRRPGRRSASI